MSTRPRPSRSITLSLSVEERWTLHHVLLHRIEREQIAANPTEIEPPPFEVFQAFETLDEGGTRFTVVQLEATRRVLETYRRMGHWWEIESSRLERLIQHITAALERIQPASLA